MNKTKRLIAVVETHSRLGSARRLTLSASNGLALLRARRLSSALKKSPDVKTESLVQQEVHERVRRSSQSSQTEQTVLQLHDTGGDGLKPNTFLWRVHVNCCSNEKLPQPWQRVDGSCSKWADATIFGPLWWRWVWKCGTAAGRRKERPVGRKQSSQNSNDGKSAN